eukprot:TRINITY_DN23763_c0_g1_i1.p1 TRINITY_DN23763_c0_g1~~TRINITY_DN23763_c0_g1_i1.p1  ORF type:complete len:470 (-),score=63.28 TRINITY_DN23763_c0_g1_i1:145-1554(-)
MAEAFVSTPTVSMEPPLALKLRQTGIAGRRGDDIDLNYYAPPAKIAASTSTGTEALPTSVPSEEIDDVWFVVFTDSKFYDTRVRYILNSWGSQLSRASLFFVGDMWYAVNGYSIKRTPCKAHSHDGACCKVAHAIYDSYARIQHSLKIFGAAPKFVFFSDDDSFLVVQNIRERLRNLQPSRQVWGLFGCGTGKCNGLCGGGGFILSVESIYALVLHDQGFKRHDFVEEFAAYCQMCNYWGDQAFSMLARNRQMPMKDMRGMHGWVMSHESMTTSLADKHFMPLTYHYIKTKEQFDFLFRLFRPQVNQTECGRTGFGACVEYRGRRCCVLRDDQQYAPWNDRNQHKHRSMAAAQVAGSVASSFRRKTRRLHAAVDDDALAVCAHQAGLHGRWSRARLLDYFRSLVVESATAACDAVKDELVYAVDNESSPIGVLEDGDRQVFSSDHSLYTDILFRFFKYVFHSATSYARI